MESTDFEGLFGGISTPSVQPVVATAIAGSVNHQHGTELVFSPIPDAVYQLQCQARVSPVLAASGQENDLLHCGESHLLAVLDACYCAADNLRGVASSPYERPYQSQLMASVLRDRDFHSPRSLGYNSDTRRGQTDPRLLNLHLLSQNLVTYDGGS